jgi:DnaJ-class molecular chaperone
MGYVPPPLPLSGPDPDDYDDRDDYQDGDYEPSCHTCGGKGWVDNVAKKSGRWGWDTDGPGDCPNCGGSGLWKDCNTF